MYQINKDSNTLTKLDEKTFADLGFKEREHLQEWIARNPEALGEELLIIQKEFNGFSDTNERLDLLALDKQGNLVVIENKLDDSGRDVTWQVIKYASYCSSLTKDQVKDIYQDYLLKIGLTESATEKIAEFFKQEFEDILINQGTSQRIIMVSRKFRREVTSTVLWLMNFSIRIQCFKVTPFALGERLFLNFEQILPIKDAEEYSISMASKAKEDIASQESSKARSHIRTEFWNLFLKKVNEKNSFWNNISPSSGSWIGIGMGMSGVNLNAVATKNKCQVEIYINYGNKERNKEIFDFIISRKEAIEKEFGGPLQWDRMDDRITSWIGYSLDNVNVFDKEDWEKITDFLVDISHRMESAFRGTIKSLSHQMRSKTH